MKRWFGALALVLILGGTIGPHVYADESPQVWLSAALAQRFEDGFEAMLETEQRFSSASHLYQRYEIMPQLIWHYSPRYDFAIGWEENREWMDNTDLGGHEPFASVTFLGSWAKWYVASRQRVQGGWNDHGKSSAEFRQQTRLTAPALGLPFRLQPYLQEEWFVDLIHGSGFRENRLQAGIAWQANRALRCEIFALRLDEKMESSTWTITPVTGLSLNFSF